MKKLSMILPLVFLLCFTFGCQKGEEMAEVEAKVEESSGIVTIDGAKIRYVSEGTGIPCIIIGSSVSWPRKTFSGEVKKQFKFISMDSRFIVALDSPVNVDSLTLDTQAADIEQVRRALGLDRICVLGHSISGIFALEYAWKYPEHVSHVIMIGTPPGWNAKIMKAGDEYWESHASEERKSILKKNWEKISQEEFKSLSPSEQQIMQDTLNAPKYHYDPAFDNSWLWEGESYNVEALNHLFENVMADYNIPLVDVPVFLALGRYDFIVPYFTWDEAKEKFPDISIYLFEESAHYPMLEEQELFDKKLIDWIKSH